MVKRGVVRLPDEGLEDWMADLGHGSVEGLRVGQLVAGQVEGVNDLSTAVMSFLFVVGCVRVDVDTIDVVVGVEIVLVVLVVVVVIIVVVVRLIARF